MNDLRSYEANTFGRKYHDWMQHSNDFSPDDRTAVRFISDPDLAYIMTRYRQIHDFLHVITDLDVTIVGELGLKWFEYHITGFRFCLLSGLAGQVRLSRDERRFLNQELIPWSYRAASKAKDILSFRYENHLQTPIAEVRDILNIETAPKY